MAVHHRLLHRMQHAVPRQMLDRHHVAEVHRRQQADAGVHRLVDQLAPGAPADQHGAGAAVALGAALLGAAQPLGRAADGRAACPTSGPRSAAPRGRSAEIGSRRGSRSRQFLRRLGAPRGAVPASCAISSNARKRLRCNWDCAFRREIRDRGLAWRRAPAGRCIELLPSGASSAAVGCIVAGFAFRKSGPVADLFQRCIDKRAQPTQPRHPRARALQHVLELDPGEPAAADHPAALDQQVAHPERPAQHQRRDRVPGARRLQPRDVPDREVGALARLDRAELVAAPSTSAPPRVAISSVSRALIASAPFRTRCSSIAARASASR